jgi:hypothetical protein
MTESFRDKQFMALLHEIHHIMGLNSQAWSRFYDKSAQEFLPESDVLRKITEEDVAEGERFTTIIKEKNFIKWISTHMNCKDAKGIPLENVG